MMNTADRTGRGADLMLAGPYTLTSHGGLVLCANSSGQPLGPSCTTAVWGSDIDIVVNNSLGEDALVDVLADWGDDGTWGGASAACGIGMIGSERVLENFVVPDGFSGPLSLLSPPDFTIVTGNKLVWFRFTITKTNLPQNWTGDGVYDFGEMEDYLLATGTTVSNVPQTGEARNGRMVVVVHDLAGRVVATLLDESRSHGRHVVTWEGRGDDGPLAAAGVYFARVISDGDTAVRRMVMLK
ncbi:MAG: hypothetical protein GY838_16535 [bacterium]|nr:hypothetical protein [bacterium]